MGGAITQCVREPFVQPARLRGRACARAIAQHTRIAPPRAALARMVALMCALACAFTCALGVCAAPASTTQAYAASSIPEYFTVYVGYSGGPFYAKKVYTNDQLWALSDNVAYEYATIDAANFLRKGFGEGVPLATLLNDAGVATSIERYYFVTADSYGGNDDGALAVGDPWGYDELMGKTRYYYPDLVTHWSFNLKQVIDIAEVEATKVEVPTVLALKSSFLRVVSEEDAEQLWNDSSRMNTNSGYRLMFGAESANQSSARSFAGMVTGITCIMPLPSPSWPAPGPSSSLSSLVPLPVPVPESEPFEPWW